MKLIFTYDSTELREAIRITATDEKVVKETHVLTVEGASKKNLYDVAIEIIKETTEGSPCIIFIDQYLSCADEGFEWLQRDAGIALIKFLRMMEVGNHIVLISPFEPYELIKLNPDNFIVSSKGISFAKYLHEFSGKTLADFKAIASNVFDDKQDIKPYILTEFRLPEDERHNWANWWGIVQLIDVHRALFPDEIGFTDGAGKEIKYPLNLENQIKTLRSQQALWLYRHKVDFTSAIIKEDEERIQKKIRGLDSEIERLEKRINGTGIKNPKPNDWTDFINDRESIIRDNKNNHKWKQETLPLIQQQIGQAKTAREAGKLELEKKKKEREPVLAQKKSGEVKVEDGFKAEFEKYRFKGKKFQPRILYIDDKADEGWSDIFHLMIYGERNPELFDIILPSKEASIDIICDEVKEKINCFDPHLILLDLRLKNEEGTQLNVDELSGAIVLKEIRKQFQGIPVLMTTASNKSWSYEELQRIGCDAFWTKEGIDTGMTERDSIKSYTRFAELVNILTGDEYKFLHSYSKNINAIKKKNDHWWLDPTWCNSSKDEYRKRLRVEQKVVFEILDDTLLIIRSYLRSVFIRSDYGTIVNEWLYPTLIIQHLAKIIEHIHGVTQSGIPTTEYIKIIRGDKAAGRLLMQRGFASHYNDAKEIKYKSSIDFIKNLIEYLNCLPKFNVEPNVIGKISP